MSERFGCVLSKTRVTLAFALAGAIGSTVALASNAPPKRTGTPAQAAKSEPTPPAGAAPVLAPPAPPRWVGTHISPQRDVRGNALVLQQKIGRKFAEVDPRNRQRGEAFSYFKPPDFQVRGWTGRIEEVVPMPNGWRVKVSIAPILSSRFSASTTVLGVVSETYRYSENKLELLETDARPGQHSSFIGD